MRIILLIFAFSIFTALAFSQVPDSLRQRYDSLNGTLNSRSGRINNKIDSLQLKANSLLNPNLSIDHALAKWKQRRHSANDSLKAVKELNSIKASYQQKIDSLTALDLPTDKYKHKLDSVGRISPQEYINRLETRAGQLQADVNKPVNDLEDRINKPINDIESKVNAKLSLMNQEGGAEANLPGNASLKNISLPGAEGNTDLDLAKKLDVDVPGVSDINMPDIKNPVAGEFDQLGELKDKIADVKDIPKQQIERIKGIDEVQAVEGKLGQANGLVDKAQAYQEDVSNIANGDLGEVKEIPKAIENRVAQMDEMKDLQKVTGDMGQYQSMIAKGNDPEALKSMAKEQAVKYAKDHFLGKEAALMAAMDKLSKVKGKFPEVASLKDLPKHVPNQMKGKPLIERIVPGFQFQIQKSSTLLIDISPTVGYRFAGRFTAGVGWNERLSFKEWNQTVPQDRIFGPRAFALFNLKKGFSLKAEGEYMNVYLPTFVTATEGHRSWVWSVFVGIQKDYTFYKNIRGNVQMLYNIYDDHGNSPYVDRFNVRMGWEFPMRKANRNQKGL